MQFNLFNKLPEGHTEEVHPAIERAHNRAIKTLKENSISLDEFEGLYDQKKLSRDREKVERKESGFAHESHKQYADVLEAIIFDQTKAGVWFSENTRAIKTSSFDDYYNGSDLILELEDTARTLSHLSLSVDVTFGTSTEKEKIAHIKKNIDDGTLGQIDYFKSSRSQFRGELSRIPQVIIGVEKDTVINLANLWMDKHEHPELAKTLDEHPIKRLILSEILLQLYTFRTYAGETNKQDLVTIFEKDIQLLEEILRNQASVDTSALRDDKVFAAIRESLSIFKHGK